MNDALKEKTVVITGATSGIGLALARLVVSKGARLIGVGRTIERCESAVALVNRENEKSSAIYIPSELSLLENVRILAEAVKGQLVDWGRFPLNYLVLNAAEVPFRQIITFEGFDTQWVVNYLSGFLLAQLLTAEMAHTGNARIILVSSDSHYRTRMRWNDLQFTSLYNPLFAYKQTKLAQVLFSAEFNRRMEAKTGITALAADPGLVKTKIGFKNNPALINLFWSLRSAWGRAPKSAAEDILFLMENEEIRGMGEVYWKYRQPKSPNPLAYDETAGRRLWRISAQMAGLNEDATDQ